MHIGKYNKIILSAQDKNFIRDNWETMTNPELAEALGLKLTKLRGFLREMGLKRMELEYWTPEQIEFLKANYKTIGDTELAEIFEIKWYKRKGWCKKHIEKKRRYLNLKRTASERNKIHKRNLLFGRFKDCAINRWKTIGIAEIGDKRVWFKSNNKPLVVIKTEKGFVHYNRWLWETYYGEIPPGMNVRIMGADKINYTEKDLVLVTDAENAMLNSKNRLPKQLRETERLMNKLNKLIIKSEKS